MQGCGDKLSEELDEPAGANDHGVVVDIHTDAIDQTSLSDYR